ncbi:hypothetical protein AB0A74_17830 [Saccharothrix sp. NPDC042600]|uniref:hypothetical protein n=1 Tax=Saccharothrix TaxID=2071 RepID=UPI0033DC23C3|nr:hypothetical protein GCM10017745_18980 [Saccharothrix mutabilis subsp. capreolus]
MTKLRQRLLLPLLAALSGLLLMAAPQAAQAAPAEAGFGALGVVAYPPTCWNKVWSPDGGAMTCFNPTGEHMYVCDIKADGHHAAAWFKGTYDTYGGYRHNYEGNGTCLDVDFDMPENTAIKYDSRNMEGDTLLSVSAPTGWISANG